MFEPEHDSPFEYLTPPYRRFVIDTLMPREAAVAAIEKIVEPRKLWRGIFSSGHREFQGEVSSEGFKVSRIIHYRNSFLPMVIGHFERIPEGTRVAITMRMAWPSITFGWIWLVANGVIAAIFLEPSRASALFGDSNFGQALSRAKGPLSYVPLGVIAFTYILCSGFFAFEARKARRILRENLWTPGGSMSGIQPG